jgi:hypothetical protein
MEFPQIDFGDENDCYQKLLEFFHPRGLRCPHCGGPKDLATHRHHRVGIVMDYLCNRSRQLFNIWTGTPLQQTHHTPSEIMRLIRGIHQGISTAQLARDLHCHRGALSPLRQRLEPWVTKTFGAPPHKKKKVRGRKDATSSRTSHTVQIGKKSRKRKNSY